MKFDFEYAKSVIISEGQAVLSMAELIDGPFNRACELVYNCGGSVIVTGVGKAGIIGQKISATLASVGTPSHFLHPVDAVHGDLGRVRAEGVVLVLSFGGESAEIIRLMNLLKQQEVKMISITGNCESSLAKYSDVVLCIGKLKEACPLGVAPSVSTTCMLALGDALALTVMKAREFSVEDFARFHPGGSLGAKLITVGQSMDFKIGEQLPIIDQNATISDMLCTTKKLKRRGAVMVVDHAGRLIGIVTDADLRRFFSDNGADALGMPVCQAMTKDCKRVKVDTLAAEAMAIFHKYRIDDLPVVDEDDKPVGMIDVQTIVSIKVVG